MKTQTKKICALLLSLLMICQCIANTVIADDVVDYPVMELGVENKVTKGILSTFVPTESSYYCFSSDSHIEGYISDGKTCVGSMKNELDPFMKMPMYPLDIKCYLEAGKTYTFSISMLKDGASCDVLVEKLAEPEAISLSGHIDFTVGYQYSYSIFFSPKNAYEKIVKWESSDDKVITIDENGRVLCKGVGSATITATSESGLVAKQDVEVKDAGVIQVDSPVDLLYDEQDEFFKLVVPSDSKYVISYESSFNAVSLRLYDKNLNEITNNSNGKIIEELKANEVYYIGIYEGYTHVHEEYKVYVVDYASTIDPTDVSLSNDNFDPVLIEVLIKFDKNDDGRLSEYERTKVTSLNVSNQKISTLDGLKYFDNLVYINVSNTEIDNLDWINQVSNLKYVYAKDNNIATISDELGSINELYLDNNKINDISEYKKLELNTNITKYSVTGNLCQVQRGDADCSDVIDANDALQVLKHSAKLIKIKNDTSADVTKDGNIDATDALEILKYSARIIESF